MRKIKPSIAKKVEQMVEESYKLKTKKNYKKAVSKLQEALDFIRSKVKDLSQRKPELEKIKALLDETYFEQIQYEIQNSKDLGNQKNFNGAIEILNDALEICEYIADSTLKQKLIKNIKIVLNQYDIHVLIEDGKKFLDEKEYDKALRVFEKALNDSYAIQDELDESIITEIKDQIDKTYSNKINILIEEGNIKKESDMPDEAIKILEDAKDIAGEISNLDLKDEKVHNLIKLINKIEIENINPIIEQGLALIRENQYIEANNTFKKAIVLIDKLYDTDEKISEREHIFSLYSEKIKPFYTKKVQPFLEKGNEIINQANYHENRAKLDEAIKAFASALDIANEMIEFKEKEKLLNQIRELLNRTCSAGINPRKEKSLQLIDKAKYDDSISELYSALSIAKNMECAEGDNEEIEDIKDLINKVYSAQIKETIDNGNYLVDQGKFDEAMETFNQALKITNKMYITPDMEREVENIKSIIYQTELKQLIDKGEVSEEESKYEDEIKKLEESLEYATKIEDPSERSKEMSKIKDSIDKVHSSEIKLYIEQEKQLVEQSNFDGGYEFIEKALKIHELIENSIFKHQERNNIIKELIKIAKKVYAIGQYDKTIKFCEKILELDKSYLDAHYYIGISQSANENHDKAIEQFKIATELDPNHVDSWNELGKNYEKKGEYNTAINFFNKTIDIDPKFAVAWYNMANSTYHNGDYEQAISHYSKAVEFNPHLANAWLFMGMAYIDKKEYDQAFKSLEKAFEINPELDKQISPLIEDFSTVLLAIKEKIKEKFEGR